MAFQSCRRNSDRETRFVDQPPGLGGVLVGTRRRRGKAPIMPSRALMWLSATRTGMLAFCEKGL